MKTAADSDCEEPRPSPGSCRDGLQVSDLDSSEEMTEKYLQLLEKEFPKKHDLNKNCGPKCKKASSSRDSSRNYKGNYRLKEEVLKTNIARGVPPDVKKMLSSMSRDGIPVVIQNDYLLVQLAKNLTQTFGNNAKKKESIRQKLREMGRFLLELHTKEVFSLEDAIKPQNFLDVLSCMKSMVGFNKVSQAYVDQGLALRLRNSLKRIGNIVLDDNRSSETMKSHARIFIESCDIAWSRHVSETADLLSGGESSPSTIRFTRDVQLFFKYLETLSASATKNLKSSENPEVYDDLSRVTLAQTSAFSKSATDVSKMTLKAFQERDDCTQILSKHFIRINILSKSGQNVAVLVTSELVGALTLLISKRLVCGVHQDNPYLFAKPDASPTSHYQGGHCIRSFSGLCRAKNPRRLRLGHHLKHIARIFQILNLENDELERLATLLGISIRSDREYYRSPEAAVELAKIAELLAAMEKGSMERSEGKPLEEVESEDKLEPDAEQDALQHIKSQKDKPFLEKKLIDSFKGRGVVSRRRIDPEAFVVEFRGNVCRLEDAPEEGCGDTLKDFLFDFSWNGSCWRLDASAEDRSLGRLVNDDHINPNCKMKKINYEGKPHLCLFAQKKILPGEEITFSYGNSSYSWRSQETSEDENTAEVAASSSEAPGVVDPEESSSYSQSSGEEYVCDEEPDSDDSFSECDPQQELSSTRPPEEHSSTRPPEEHSSTRPPEELKSTRPPEELKSTRPPEGLKSTRPPEELKSTRPPEGLKSTRSPEELSSRRPPEELKSTRSPEELSTIPLNNQSDESDSDEFETPTCTNKNFCYICGKSLKKMSRHLFTHRKEEPEVAEAFALPKRSKKRKELLKKLVRRGNFKHNQEVLKTRKGCLKARITSDTFSLEKSAACIYCKVLLSRKVFWKHLQACPLKVSAPPAGSRSQILALVSTGLTNPKYMSSGVRKIFKKLNQEETGSSAFKDVYILQLAQCLDCALKGKFKDVEIKLKLKLMGNLLSALNKKSILSFGDALKPQNFDIIVETVRNLAGFDKETTTYKNRLSKLVSCLRKMADIKYALALNEGANMEMMREAEEFIKLFVKEWPSNVPLQLRVPCPSTLPFIHDVQHLFKHIHDILTSAIKSLTMYASPPVYTALLKVVVAYVMILNRNVRDVSDVTLESFQKRNETEPQEDSGVNRSQFEDILCTVKVYVADQKGKKMALVLTPDLLAAITLLVEKRQTCGVPENHPFLFAKSGSSHSAVLRGQSTLSGFLKHSEAKDLASIRSSCFRKHTGMIFQILNFSNEEFGQVAKLLGRDIQTEKEFYQKPEAAADIARILVLLSAVETGCLEIFEGKSLEEIEIPDELQPVVESNRRDEEASLQEDGASPSASASRKRKRSSSARSRRKSRKEEKNPEGSEPDSVTEKDKNAERRPEEDPPPSQETPPQIYFSDDEDDMNVAFNMDFDTDGDDDDGGSRRCEENPEDKPEEMKQRDPAEEEESKREDDEDEAEDAWTDVDGDGSSPPRTEKNNLADMLKKMKEIKILIPRLNLEKMESPVLLSKLNQQPTTPEPTTPEPTNPEPTNPEPTNPEPTNPEPTNPEPTNPEPTNPEPTNPEPTNPEPTNPEPTNPEPTNPEPTNPQLPEDRGKPTSTSREEINEPNDEKAVQMNCSCCRKSMMKGQTAYKKKNFTDLFCSKSCLFEKFPATKTAARSCFYCFRDISQPLDLIMAAVDLKGTMKDFCSVTCLCSFKSKPSTRQTRQSIPSHVATASTQTSSSFCGTCDGGCSTTPGHDVSSDVRLDAFCRDGVGACDVCGSACRENPLTLKLEDGTKTICSSECLEEFKEANESSHPCTLCRSSLPVHKTVAYRNDQNVVELFCSGFCVRSHKVQLQLLDGSQSSGQGQRNSRRSELKPTNEDGPNEANAATTDRNFSPVVETDDVARLITQVDHGKCCSCFRNLTTGQNVYQLKRAKKVFCSEVCVAETCPHVTFDTRKCYNCCQLITQPQKVILAPADDSGSMKELCSETCLTSVKSKRTHFLCRLCAKRCFCKFSVTVDGEVHRFCSDSCVAKFNHKKLFSWFVCEICGTLCSETRVALRTGDGVRTVCGSECLLGFKEKAEAPQLCPTCRTPHQLSDMLESQNRDGVLDLFCSHRCMKVHTAQTFTPVSGNQLHVSCFTVKTSPSLDEDDIKDVKPSLLTLPQIKQEPVDEEYTRDRSGPVSLRDVKEEPDELEQELKIDSVFSLTEESEPAGTDSHASCSACRSVLVDGERVYQRKAHADLFCSTSCLLKFYQRKPTKTTSQPCATCRSSKPVADMVESRNEKDDVVELFCSKSCAMASKLQNVCASGASPRCDNCRKTTAAVCHLAMSDASIRNFCSLTCAMDFKETQKDQILGVNDSGAQNQTQNDSNGPPEDLLCAQCLQTIQTAPQPVQNKKRVVYVCSSACSLDFKRINNIVGSCEHCQNLKLINQVKRVDNKICLFCSDVCFRFFLHDLKRMWGKVCSSCSFCRSVSKTAVAALDGGAEEFCSETCRTRHHQLLRHLLKCDSCGRRGRLSESLPLSGGVKRFCHLKCLLCFCRTTEPAVDSGSSPAGLTDLVSLSSALKDHLNSLRSSPHLGPLTDIQTKVVGHASVQTDPTELKNKATLCVPLVHNKGVSCSVQTVEAAAQTVVFKEKVREKLLPLPVPIFVPLPMNMYSQYTPAPLPLPVPLPVPVFLPEKQSSSGPTEEDEVGREPAEEDLNFSPQEEADRDEPKEEDTHPTPSLVGNISSPLEPDPNNQNKADSILELFFESQPVKIPSKDVPEGHLPPPPPPPPQQEDHHKTALTDGETLPCPAAKGAAPQPGPRKKAELSGRRGVRAWRRWIERRGSQTHLAPAGTLKADPLECSSSELNDGLCLFIQEAGRSADTIFYLCLCIQQYLFENGRPEDIFCDQTFQRFSSEMTTVLKRFKAPGSVRSCVEEDFLWGCKHLGASSPTVLLNTLLFFCCRHFGFTSVEQHRRLAFAFVFRYTKTNPDSSKTAYLRFNPPRNQESPGTAGGVKAKQDPDGVPAKKRKLNENFLKVKENKKNPLRCPVKLYEFYLSKCPESVRRRSDVFYLQPDRRCLPSSPVWFSTTPLDDATMEAMIVRTLAVRQKNRGLACFL